MNCKKCGRGIPDGSAFCNWCGAKQIKPKRGSAEITVPKARQLSSGTWFIQLRLGGDSISVTADTERQCRAKALMIKTEHMNGKREVKDSTPGLTLRQCCRKYVDDHRATLSPSTVRGYEIIIRNRFKNVMDTQVEKIENWQTLIGEELKNVSSKTVNNAFGLLFPALTYCGYTKPKVKLPKIAEPETEWLDYEQVLQFCEAIKGKPGELGALLALHSLRRSEIMGLTGDKIDKSAKRITVRGGLVPNEKNKFVRKETNKTKAGTRSVPFIIPRLEELLPDVEPDARIVPGDPNALYKQINRVCKANGLPEVGIHGLRRSFASLGYHLGWSERMIMEIGGWDDLKTVHKMYVRLAEADKAEAAKSMLDFYTNANQTLTNCKKG